MSDIDWDNLDEDEANTPLVKQLRKQVESMSKQLKAISDTKRADSLKAVLAKLPENVRAKATKLIGESDPDEWLGEYGDIFGRVETPATAEAEAPAVPAEDIAALSAVSAAVKGSTTPDADTRAKQAIAEVTDPAALTALLLSELGRGR